MDDSPLQVGDFVTRDGSDVQRVTRADDGYGTIEVVCVKAPQQNWCKVGDVESNLASRYNYAGDVIDGEVTVISGRLPR